MPPRAKSRAAKPKRPYARKPKMVPEQPALASDQDLGIGEDLTPGDGAELAALLNNPALAKLIDAAVTARLAQMGAGASAPNLNPDAFAALAQSLGHMIEVNAMQQPGYIKPLPAAEVDRRLAGKVEMLALLADYERNSTPPLWMIGESGFFECTNAVEFNPGEEIRTYLPPVEDFVPRNVQAEKVHAAMMQWLGGSTLGIGEQVQAAMIAAKQAPMVTNVMQADKRPGSVELVSRPGPNDQPASRRRSMGSLVPERRDISLAERAAGPSGPAFGEAA